MNRHGAAFLHTVMDLLVDAICVVDASGRFVFLSAACERIFGYSAEEMVGQPMIDFVWPEDRARTLEGVDKVIAGTQDPHFENRYRRKDGRAVYIMWSARWSEADQVRVAVARDVTERRRAESMRSALYAVSEAAHTAEDLVALFERVHRIVGDLLPALNFFVALYDEATDALTFPYYVDTHHQPPAPLTLSAGTLSAEVIRGGQPLLLRSDSPTPLPARVKLDVGKGSLDWLGVPLRTLQGTIGVLVVQSYSGDERYTDADVELLQFVSDQVATAIERKRRDTWLRHIARHDPLTDLPNRALLHDRMEAALQRARKRASRFAVLYLDLDMFKQINDSFGHAVGDLLLQETALRLRHCVGASDTVGRIGGDEFVVLLDNDHSAGQAMAVAGRILSVLRLPFMLAARQLQVSPSIGIALYPEHGDDHKQLIRYADEAMYAAKKSGGNRALLTRSGADTPD